MGFALTDLLILLAAFALLSSITDRHFIPSLEYLATRMRMTSDMAGATLMAVGSSAPELFTSFLALVKGMEHSTLGAGTIVGSALFNLLVIVGASALVRPIQLTWQPALRDLSFYLATVGLLYLTLQDGQITLWEAIGCVGFYGLYLLAIPLWKKAFPYEAQIHDESPEKEEEDTPPTSLWGRVNAVVDVVVDLPFKLLGGKPHHYAFQFFYSIVGIALLSWILVEAGVDLATSLGIPGAVIGLTVLAVGTSVPDLISSIQVARRGLGDMAVANAVGSNVFDILVGLGLVWLVMVIWNGQPVIVPMQDLNYSVLLLLGSVALMLAVFLLRRWRLGRLTGGILVFLYLAFVAQQISQQF